MRRFLLAAVMFGAVSGAQAADLPDFPVLRGSQGLSTPTRNWDGWYAGGQVRMKSSSSAETATTTRPKDHRPGPRIVTSPADVLLFAPTEKREHTLERLLTSTGWTIVRMMYTNALLVPPLTVLRALQRWRGLPPEESAERRPLSTDYRLPD